MTRVLFVQYANAGAYPPIQRAAHLLSSAGCAVRVLGVGVSGTEPLKFAGGPDVEHRALGTPPRGWRLKLHYLRYAMWCLTESLLWRAHWVYSSDSLAAPIGLALSYLPGVRVIFHEHDTPEIPGRSVFGRMCIAARSRLARRAALVIAPNAERARRLRNGVARGGAVQTVWNCPLRSEVREARDRDGRALRIIFQGSVVPERGAMTMVRALALLPSEVEFVVVGYETLGSPGFVEKLLDEARRLGVAERMRLAGALPHGDAMALCASCDLGLAIASAAAADDNLRTLAGASNKVFEYLACGVVPIVPDTEEWRADFVDPGLAIACDPDSPSALANVIGVCVADRDGLRERGARGRERILDDWNYETAFAPVLRTICETALVAASRAPASKAAPSSVAAR